jgi:preprotein translocase subunit SecA
MNKQRMVIYDQRNRVLRGEDLSEEIHLWIEEAVGSALDEYTAGEYAEEWDVDSLVGAMQALYGSDITAEELREEVELSRDALVEEFTEDASDVYRAKEEELGAELMRELERFIILQVVDLRWREHLENMEYLREGVHLRAMAQKDPLVEYTAEGEAMFRELGRNIREEVVQTLFHVEVEPMPEDAVNGAGLLPEPVAPNGGNGNLTYQHETARGSDAIMAAGAAPELAAVGGGGLPPEPPQQRVVSERDQIGRNDPCWCGSGKKYKRCHGA